jgi:hypothetical protein
LRASRLMRSAEVAGVACVGVGDVDEASALQRRHRLVRVAVADPERIANSGWGGRRLPEVGKPSSVAPRGDRREPDVPPSTRRLQRERHAFTLCDSEPAQHLGADQVVRNTLAEAPLVVAGDQRPDAGDDLVDRNALDRDELRARLVAVDDCKTIREPVSANGVEVQRPRVRVQRVDARVPVALAEERKQTHQLHHEVVAVERAGPTRELVDASRVFLAGSRVVRVRVNPFELRGEEPHVALGSRHDLRRVARRAADRRRDDEQHEHQPARPPAHGWGRLRARRTQSAHSRSSSACWIPLRSRR